VAETVNIKARRAVAHTQLVADVFRRAGAFQHVELGLVHGAQIVVLAVAGKDRKHLNAHAAKVVAHDFHIALNIVVAHVVDDVAALDFRLDRAHLLVDPGYVDLVVPAGLAGPGKAGRIAHKNVNFGHFFHDLLGQGVDIIADEGRGAGLVNGHALDVRKSPEGLLDAVAQLVFRAKDHVLFLHVRGEGVLELEVAVVADVALGLPCIIGTAHGAVAQVDHVLHGRADHMLGPAKGAATLGNTAWDRVQVSKWQAGGEVIAFALDHCVLFPLGDAFAAFEKMVWHISILYAA